MGIRRCAATAGAMTALLATGWAAPAQATIYERENFRFSESVEEELCGIAVRRDTTARGTLRVRTGKGDLDQAFFGSASVRFTDTFTNLETTASFSISGTGVFGKDIRPRRWATEGSSCATRARGGRPSCSTRSATARRAAR
jgi:hypothetical protein